MHLTCTWLTLSPRHPTPAACHLQVTDTTTFTDDKRRAEVDAWLYDTCTRTLQHIVDIVVQYYSAVSGEAGSLDWGLGWGQAKPVGLRHPAA